MTGTSSVIMMVCLLLGSTMAEETTRQKRSPDGHGHGHHDHGHDHGHGVPISTGGFSPIYDAQGTAPVYADLAAAVPAYDAQAYAPAAPAYEAPVYAPEPAYAPAAPAYDAQAYAPAAPAYE